MFKEMTTTIIEGAQLLKDMMDHFENPQLSQKLIKDVEHKADGLTHDIIKKLNKSFVTPLDREDIYSLAGALDDILDLIDAAAHRLMGYKIEAPTPDLVSIGKQLSRPLESFKAALLLLDDMKNSRSILDLCVEINRLEIEADVLHRIAITNLFDNEKDPIRVIKFKEIYENLEEATDRCEDVANIIESVVIKNS